MVKASTLANKNRNAKSPFENKVEKVFICTVLQNKAVLSKTVFVSPKLKYEFVFTSPLLSHIVDEICKPVTHVFHSIESVREMCKRCEPIIFNMAYQK